MELEKLDLKNVIEINRIRKILNNHPDLLSMFELIIIVANKRLNEEAIGFDNNNDEIEDNNEPDLSDHESDEEGGDEVIQYPF